MVRCPIELLQLEFKNGEHVRNLFVSYSETLLSRSSTPSLAIPCIRRKKECADGCS